MCFKDGILRTLLILTVTGFRTGEWLDNTVFDSEIQIAGYDILRKDRSRHGGGVCIYIRSDLAFNQLDELSHEELEATWIEISLPKTKPIVCGVVYRPPHQNIFMNYSNLYA